MLGSEQYFLIYYILHFFISFNVDSIEFLNIHPSLNFWDKEIIEWNVVSEIYNTLEVGKNVRLQVIWIFVTNLMCGFWHITYPSAFSHLASQRITPVTPCYEKDMAQEWEKEWGSPFVGTCSITQIGPENKMETCIWTSC